MAPDLRQLALSGAALLTIEASAITPEGRITYADVGLYSDETETAMARTLSAIRKWSDMPIAIQLAHADRKASSEKPWLGGAQISPIDKNGWQTVAHLRCRSTPIRPFPLRSTRKGYFKFAKLSPSAGRETGRERAGRCGRSHHRVRTGGSDY